jgi:hypothetical protein
VAERCTICSSNSRRPVRKLLGAPSYASTWMMITPEVGIFTGLLLCFGSCVTLSSFVGRYEVSRVSRNHLVCDLDTVTPPPHHSPLTPCSRIRLEKLTSNAKVNNAWQVNGIALGFESRQGLGIFLFTTAPRPAQGPTQAPIQCVPGAFSLGVKLPGREALHLPLLSAFMALCSVKAQEQLYLYTSAPPIRLHGVVLS